MNKIFKKALIIVLCLAMVLSLAACGSSNAVLIDPLKFDKEHTNKTSDSFMITNDSSAYELHWDAENYRILLRDKVTGEYHCATPSEKLESRVGDNGFPITNHPKLESNIIIEYVDTVNNFATKTANGYVRSLKTKTYSIEKTADGNGFKLIYYFDNADISIPVIYTLLDDGIKMTIVPEEITESGDNILHKVSISPFFVSVPNIDEDAYLFYPSGSGAIINANNSKEISTYFSNEVYGYDALQRDYMGIRANPVEYIRMPVFGAKNGDKGVVAIISEGAETALIEGDIGNATIGYSGLYATFKIRGTNIASKVANGLQYSEQYAHTPMSVCFYPLSGEDASYVGMAKRYREFLQNERGMTDKAEKASAGISLVGGSLLDTSFLGMPTKEVFATTTVKEAETIITELDSKLQLPLVADLVGFGSSGIDVGKPAGNLKLAKNIGTEAQAKELSAKCKELGIDLYLDFDLVHFNSNGLGLTVTSGGSAKGPGHVYTRFYAYRLGDSQSSFMSYLVGRDEHSALADKAADFTKSMDIQGISFRKLTSLAYSDYAANRTIAKANMGNDVSAILQTMNKAGLKVLANQANDYAAINSDVIIEAPICSSMLSIFDYDVPFYQIVLKGHVPMFGTAVNTTTNKDLTVLRCVEGGSALRYSLINNYDNDLLTSISQIFNAVVYEDNAESLVATINANTDYFKAIEDAHIVNHVCINTDVRKVVYDNGIVVYVNYGDVAYESELGNVEAGSYIYGKEVSNNG
ncbi:MAG: hypothetical protein IJ946_02880 [Clostridia bacterium]|nr:hypothetical protein [Clostridia bacterium]